MQNKIIGLTTRQAEINRKKYGENKLPRLKMYSAWDFFVDVFRDKLNLVLLFMMLMFLGLGIAGYGSIYEAVGIGVVLFVVAFTTVVTKLKTQRGADKLYRKSSMFSATVIRNGAPVRLDSTMVVVNDVVKLCSGEKICADGYVISGSVDVNNAILNGESDEVKKTAVPSDYKYDSSAQINADTYTDSYSVFAGTTVKSGECYMRVTRVGANTENAKIMSSLYSIDDVKTTLQIQLDNLASLISKFGSICALVIFGVLLTVRILSGDASHDMSGLYVVFSTLTIALTIFVAAVPEGLPFIIGIITGQNVERMIRSNILAKNPHKIPESGNIQLLCTDKTGTLTYGFMQPVHNFTGACVDMGFDSETGGDTKQMFLQNIALTCDCVFDKRKNVIGGNSTSRALFESMKSVSKQIADIQSLYPVSSRIVFNSKNKFSGALSSVDGNRGYYMGAPEVILSKARFYIDSDGQIKKINKTKLQNLIQSNARRAMRLVATAFSPNWHDEDTLPDDLIFISMVAMRDNVRDGVPSVIDAMNKSGVQVMMITGDNLDTARAIATDCGIITSDSDIAITASEFDSWTDARARRSLRKIKVVARAVPETKLRLVRLAQSLNLCIGMCGDGTNDAPALKGADVGFAMGDGTDVCKEASDIIITDNNFLSIANCVLLGRTFVHNVISFLKFQLPINFALVILSIVFPIAFGLDAFTAVQILLINIVMDSLNSLAFGGEPPYNEYLLEPAQGKSAPLLSRNVMMQIIWTTFGFCCVFALLSLLQMHNIFDVPGAYMSARFALLVIMSVVNGFCVRTKGFLGLSKNPMFIVVACGIIVCTMLVVTFGGSVLQLSPLSLNQWLLIFGLSLVIIPINFIRGIIMKK